MIDEFIDALAECYDAKAELQKCRDGCEYDAGYFCQQYEQYYNETKQKAEEIMRKVIRTELKVVK